MESNATSVEDTNFVFKEIIFTKLILKQGFNLTYSKETPWVLKSLKG